MLSKEILCLTDQNKETLLQSMQGNLINQQYTEIKQNIIERKSIVTQITMLFL